MKKLLIVSDTYHQKYDGIVRFLDETIEILNKHFEVTLLIPNFKKENKKFKVIQIETSKKISVMGYYSAELSKKTKEIVENAVKENDIIFTQDIATLGILAIHYAKKHGKKSVNYLHQIPWEMYGTIFGKRKINRKLLRYIILKSAVNILGKCNKLIVSSKELLNDEHIIKLPIEKSVVALGVNLKTFKPTKNKIKSKEKIGINKNSLVIGYAGRISPEKDLLTLTKAFTKLKNENNNCVLLIIGEGDQEIRKKIKSVKGVIVKEFTQSIEDYYQAMDIFVLPSLTETNSLVVMEAMACEIEVITTPVGNTKFYIKDGINGYFFPIGNSEKLYELLNKSIKENKMKSLGVNARKTIKQYTWKDTIKKLVKELDSVK